MKLALLCPGYLDSPDYLHMQTFQKALTRMGYEARVIDPCGLWQTDDMGNYTVTNYLKDIKAVIDSYSADPPTEVVILGHSLGGLIAILAGDMFPQVTHVISLCAPKSVGGLGKKWLNGGPRVSQRDLPDDPSQFRHFTIPYSFVTDAKKYSPLETIKKIHQPLMILIAEKDESVPLAETEELVKNAVGPYVVRVPGIGHNFRHSQSQCDLVMSKIQDFLQSHPV